MFVVPFVLLALGLAVTVLYVDAEALLPALHSTWLVIHVAAAIISSGAFCFAGILAAAYLVQERAERVAPGGRLSRLLPSSMSLDAIAYRVIAFTFPLWTFAIIAGAIWAENAWGTLLGLGPQGDLGVHHLGRSTPPTCTPGRRRAGAAATRRSSPSPASRR